MKRLSFLAMFIAMILGASAQQYMHVWSDGAWVSWPVLNVDSITFTDGPLENVPDEPQEPTPIVGVFSVGEGKTVTFSPGNLQYHPANDEWRFAENQWDYVNNVHDSITQSFDGWIDWFLWGLGNNLISNFLDSVDFVDWGTNKIGEDKPHTWRTLTGEEWRYLRWVRENCASLCGVAQVNGVNGLILLPDNWSCPAGITFKSGFHTSYGMDSYVAYQSFTAEQWAQLETAGAVFLPASGGNRYNHQNRYEYCQLGEYYWASSECSPFFSDAFYFDAIQCTYTCTGIENSALSVRLVKDVEGGTVEPENPGPDTPEEPTDPYNGHEYVDLGLSVKWATCNVGANAPEESGDYFAWGETQTDAAYNWNLYEWCLGTDTSISKYCTDSFYGTVDSKTVLEASDDVATVKWGGAWRMPTKEEQDELREQCTCTWTTQNGVNGYQVTGPNGNSIFLPAAGYCFDSSLDNVGSYGYYWSSSLFTNDSRRAYELAFYSDVVGWSEVNRNYGQSVRPVCL